MFSVLKKPKHQFEVTPLIEQCKNPLKPNCHQEEIVVYIQIGQEKLPLCCQCWTEMAESNVEWDEEGLKTEKETLHSNLSTS
jgi:hypothetical protein